MTITTRKLDPNTFYKAQKFLQQVGEVGPDNSYCYMLHTQGSGGDWTTLDACVHLTMNRITVVKIWFMVNNHKRGTISPRNPDGEKGSYARILGEKYLNRLLDILATANDANIEEYQTMVTITPDIVQRIEADIDRGMDPSQITETDITKYSRFEISSFTEAVLRRFFGKLGEDDCNVAYDKGARVFEVALHSSGLNIRVPLTDVVRKKWETGECFAKAAVICGSDMYLIADNRKAMEEQIVNELLERLMPELRKYAEQGPETLEELINIRTKVLKLQAMFYCEGREHSEAGYEKLCLDEFLDLFDESDPVKHATHIVSERLYGAYSCGFDGKTEIPV